MKEESVWCVAGSHYDAEIVAGKQAGPMITASFSFTRRVAMRKIFGNVHS